MELLVIIYSIIQSLKFLQGAAVEHSYTNNRIQNECNEYNNKLYDIGLSLKNNVYNWRFHITHCAILFT